ncbi:class I SAM-dependent RNA methyltransferase [Sphingomonas flavescens]|uniref:class I SAM-dependent RNA methyltransferase n=1 Tax=Sphingomonas flavescens TaxID=3132797 RepID=UPI0028046D1A|nr:class I SAM-dependent RNA methyltransferase [Sphingomonas limnosediminicola]
MNEPIVRIAARGDGVTPSGRHIAFGVPGDAVLDDGALALGPHHQEPPCRHFPECGGCQLQHADDTVYRDFLVSRVKHALKQHGIETAIRPPHLSPPCSRRRAALKAMSVGQRVLIGFNAAQSHRIVDMHECHVLRPELFELVEPLRHLLNGMIHPKRVAEVQLTLLDRGVDVQLKSVPAGRLTEIEALTSFAMDYQLARLGVDRGLGPEALYEPIPATIVLAGVPVAFAPGSFLQATEDGERALLEAVEEAVASSGPTADLFAGLGTFALGIGATYAAEASRDAAAALQRAAPAMKVEHRDLYRRPLDPSELKTFGSVVLDPPRAGATEQIEALGRSSVGRIAYVSCNPATFARDADTLLRGGYRLEWVQLVGQFRWSTHVELAACFTRG